MARNQIIGRIEKLEQRQPALSYKGADRFIWNGPKDDASLAEAEQAAEASGKLLIVRRIVDPPQGNHQTILQPALASPSINLKG